MDIREANEISTKNQSISKALLIASYKGAIKRQIAEEHLEELEQLADTYGIEAVKKVCCQVRKIEASTFLGSGKIDELVTLSKELGVNLIIFDDDITPAQQRNLEKLFQLTVMDRTEVILGVFAQRAQTKEARLQIELAQVKYQYPRLKRLWTHLSRQQGGGIQSKGEGEKQIEIDRRLLQKKLDRLQEELHNVKLNRETQRVSRARSEIPIFAIIGYTNAGKSTLLNALTDANVFVEDKLFATLDTTTRKYNLNNNQDILLIDTVGFIRKLPHLLVAAFKSTLEEAVQADILLHLVDASHPAAEDQIITTIEVLKDLNAGEKPVIIVLNKVDKCPDPEIVSRLQQKYSKSVQISALNKTGFKELEDRMIEELSKKRKYVNLRIPQSDYAVVSEIMRFGNIINQEYDENDVIMKVDIPNALAGKFQKYIQE